MGLLEEIKDRNVKIIRDIITATQKTKITKKETSDANEDEFLYDSYANLNNTNYESPIISKAMYDKIAYDIMEKHATKSNKKGCKVNTKKVEKLDSNTTKTTYYTNYGNIVHTKSIEGSKCFPIEKNTYMGYVDYFYGDKEESDTPLKVFANIECKNLQGSNANFEGFVIDHRGSVIKVKQDSSHEDINFPNLHTLFQSTINTLEENITKSKETTEKSL